MARDLVPDALSLEEKASLPTNAFSSVGVDSPRAGASAPALIFYHLVSQDLTTPLMCCIVYTYK